MFDTAIIDRTAGSFCLLSLFGCVGVNDDVDGLGAHFGAELSALFQIDLVRLVTVLVDQLVNPELTDNLLGGRFAAFHMDLDLFFA